MSIKLYIRHILSRKKEARFRPILVQRAIYTNEYAMLMMPSVSTVADALRMGQGAVIALEKIDCDIPNTDIITHAEICSGVKEGYLVDATNHSPPS